jgi:prophage regulatory protein
MSKQEQTDLPRRVLRFPHVKVATGLTRTTIYEGMVAGTFPKPIRLGVRAVGWLASDIDQWLDQRIAERDARLSAAPRHPARAWETA